MLLAGKSEPDTENLNKLSDAGFDYFELYLNTTILDEQDAIVEQCRAADPEIATVHTPHLNINSDTTEYFRETDRIAAELDATLVLDSNPTSTRYIPNLVPDSDITAPAWGYENDPSISAYYMEVNHLKQGLPLVLDTAHLHMSEGNYLSFIESLLATYDTDLIPAVHLADGVRTNDGVPFGEGTVDIPAVVSLLDTYDYEGAVVLETPQSAQPAALEEVQRILSDE